MNNLKFPAVIPVLLLLLVFNAACEKKKATPGDKPIPATPPVTYPDYSALKTGNYWIYAYYQVEPNGNSTLTNDIDSCYVEKDTLIRQATFFKLRRHELPQNVTLTSYLRDSLSYVIDQTGKILFSSGNFSTVFYTYYILAVPSPDTLYKVSTKMADENLAVQVPAGLFTTSNFQSTYLTYPRFSNPRASNTNYANARYAQNKGLILQTEPLVFESSYVTERRLVRYHLN